jgi:murein DD-endopeptidase MepM/ murein hydrolase activator NlpD
MIAVLLPAAYMGSQAVETRTQLAAAERQQFTNTRDNYITRALDSRRTLYQRRKDLVFLNGFLKGRDLHDWVRVELDDINSSISAEEADYPLGSKGNRPISITDITPTGAHSKSTMAPLGQFIWPVNHGRIDPRTINYQSHRKGISISAELGEPIVAVNDGKVIYSDNQIRGYGNVIVIQHNDELVSIYANNQLNYVDEGDQVRKGQLIADVGQLFNTNDPGLYFEMRFNGKAEDPFNYLTQRNSMSGEPSRLPGQPSDITLSPEQVDNALLASHVQACRDRQMCSPGG